MFKVGDIVIAAGTRVLGDPLPKWAGMVTGVSDRLNLIAVYWFTDVKSVFVYRDSIEPANAFEIAKLRKMDYV